MSIRDFPRNIESRNLSRDNLSREIGRMGPLQVVLGAALLGSQATCYVWPWGSQTALCGSGALRPHDSDAAVGSNSNATAACSRAGMSMLAWGQSLPFILPGLPSPSGTWRARTTT